MNGCISEIYSQIRTKHASQSHLLLLEWALTFLLQCKRDVHFNCKHESGICVCYLIAARNKIVHSAPCGKCIRLRIMLSEYNFGLKIAFGSIYYKMLGGSGKTQNSSNNILIQFRS
ncbi:Hypothetical_protein [Hexamita inflata]|uniref:Hypothetical_protein n=1 Tax=Hexamita inflata TaxID=28002 RepID=A0AA86UPP4_9EUKA|nr:Hypothetical protein HINF_LOCUS47221 [Hexamita inflata]